MSLLLLPASLLLSCARPPAVPGVQGVELHMQIGPDVPALCLSPVSAAEVRLSRKEQAVVDANRKEVSEGIFLVAEDAPAHPAVDVLRGATMVGFGRTDEARAIFRDLANEYRDDACLQQAAAYTSIQDGELDFARPYLQAAEELAPGDPDIALLAAIVAVSIDGDADGALRRLRPVAAAHPEHVGVNAWTGRLLLQRGDADLALPHLRRAFDGGAEVVGALVLATRLAGDLDGYLQLVGASPPLPVDVRAAPSPATALAESLGVAPGQPLTATLKTSMGRLHCDLFWEQAPLTVGAFVGLSRGGTPWADPQTGAVRTDALYPGTIFHRVIPQFMIQGGDPVGNGTGGPGYAFPDEIVPGLSFDRPGRLAMANSGPNTNGSQWFVTEVPVPHLDGKHTIFGQCDAASVDVVKAIARVKTGAMDLPLTPVVLETIEITAAAAD